MENNYKTFMDKQHPSEALIADTISKAKELSAEDISEEFLQKRRFLRQGTPVFVGKWMAAALVVFCLVVAVWQWNTRLEYTELAGSYISDGSNPGQWDSFAAERNSYLGAEDLEYYVFDGESQVLEVPVSKGTITVQVGTVKHAGRQSLYATKPASIRGHEVYIGKIIADDLVFLYAAFELEGKHYYLVGKNVAEREMTAYIRDLLKQK